MTRVLVVEDEPAIAESLAYTLQRDGFVVTVASTLAEARLCVDDADLVVLDLMLPDGSGFDLLTKLRSKSSTAVIVLSSRDGEADRVAALETGADDYVTKPFSPREVVARVRAVLRRVGAAQTSSPTAGPAVGPDGRAEARPVLTGESAAGGSGEPPLGRLAVSVDPASRRATVHGTPVELTRVEFDLLACMLASPGRVYTRAQLIDEVWGDGFAISDRTIDSHVKALRRKVSEAGGDAATIETVRGVGYRMTDVQAPAAGGNDGSPPGSGGA